MKKNDTSFLKVRQRKKDDQVERFNLTLTDQLLLNYITTYCTRRSTYGCVTPDSILAIRTGCSLKTAEESIKRLKKFQLIESRETDVYKARRALWVTDSGRIQESRWWLKVDYGLMELISQKGRKATQLEGVIICWLRHVGGSSLFTSTINKRIASFTPYEPRGVNAAISRMIKKGWLKLRPTCRDVDLSMLEKYIKDMNIEDFEEHEVAIPDNVIEVNETKIIDEMLIAQAENLVKPMTD